MRRFFTRIKLLDLLALLSEEETIIIYKNNKMVLTEQTVEDLLNPYMTRITEVVYEAFVTSIKIKRNKVVIMLDL